MLLPEFFSTFPFVWSFFYYRSSSWRLYMVVHQGFNSFSKCSSRFLLELKHSCIPKWNSFSYLLRWCYVILDNLSSRFMIHMLSRMRYFKSTNLFVGVILCHVSPKAFPMECCYCGAYLRSKFSPFLSMKEVFISSLLSTNQLFLLVAGCHLITLRCFHKPTTSLFFSLLVFQQVHSILLCKDAFQVHLW